MKKVCCSLLLLLFTFVCLFATIPKNKVSADSIIQNSSYDFPYIMPTIINYSFGDVRISTTPDLLYSVSSSGADWIQNNNTILVYDDSVISSRTELSSSIGVLDTNLDLADYWPRYDNSKDNKYYFIQDFSSFPNGSSGDLIINMVFTNVLLNYQFIVDYSDVNLLMFEHPFTAANYNIDLNFRVSYPHDPFSYTNADNQAVVGRKFDTHEINGTITEYFGWEDPISLDIIKMLDLENRDIMQNNPTQPILLDGSLRITIPNWENIVASPGSLTFGFDVVTHPFSSYLEYPENAIGIYPGPEFYDYYILPRGLPVECSTGGACEDDGFIENISTSLLNGVQNFLTFEISPGFSLYHILLLVVAIPLLILILKLFLGG